MLAPRRLLRSLKFEVREAFADLWFDIHHNSVTKSFLFWRGVMREDLAEDGEEARFLLSDIRSLGWKKSVLCGLVAIFFLILLVLVLTVFGDNSLTPSETLKNLKEGR